MVMITYVALPVITRHPNKNGSITEAEGEDVMLKCVANGTGTLNYQWMRKSGPLPKNIRITNTGQKLTINNITVNDSGQYYCKVDNGGESVSSEEVQVIVKSKLLKLCIIASYAIDDFRLLNLKKWQLAGKFAC